MRDRKLVEYENIRNTYLREAGDHVDLPDDGLRQLYFRAKPLEAHDVFKRDRARPLPGHS